MFVLIFGLSLPLLHPIPVTLGLGLPSSGPLVVMNAQNPLSRYQPLPQISPRCRCLGPLRGRMPYQGYESSCSGRHYCLRGMDYFVTEDPSGETSALRAQQPIVRSAGPGQPPPASHAHDPAPRSRSRPRQPRLQKSATPQPTTPRAPSPELTLPQPATRGLLPQSPVPPHHQSLLEPRPQNPSSPPRAQSRAPPPEPRRTHRWPRPELRPQSLSSSLP